MNVLRRLPYSRFSEILPAWKGRTAVVIGGGPSLSKEAVELVRQSHAAGLVECIAVNASYLWADFASVVYFADFHFWRWHQDGIDYPAIGMKASDVRERFASFTGQKCTIQNTGGECSDEVHVLRNKHHPVKGVGLSLDPQTLVTGHNSGFQVLNLAIIAGATTVILLGFDGKPENGADGRSHWHGAHPRPTPAQAYEWYRRGFSAAENGILEAGVKVINCSPGSWINSFPKADLLAALTTTEERAEQCT